jgi:hypothetical protein
VRRHRALGDKAVLYHAVADAQHGAIAERLAALVTDEDDS